MKATLKWLSDFVSIDAPLVQVCEKLTMAGLEVMEMRSVGGWKHVVVGEIVEVKPHPHADRLHLATVNLGDKQQTVICGAPNLVIGDRIAFASVGAELVEGHSGEKTVLKPAKIRGIPSEGMICSEKELGISDSHEGILVLQKEAPLGMALDEYMGDTLLDIEVTPNRADCLSVIGIAREIAAQIKGSLNIPQVSYAQSGKPIESYISVEIRDADLCPRYCASLITDIKLEPSPGWMQQRLLACGMRPINNIVDITNYVMLEYGQPLHAFDYGELRGGKIIVRRARSGDSIVTLDGVARNPDTDMLLIADEERALAIAGIMGGEGTEISERTSTVLIESANFNQAVIHRGSVKLKLASEASLRFEKGLSPELAMEALKRATQLLQDLAHGQVAPGIIDVYPGKQEVRYIAISTAEVNRLLGIEVSMSQMVQALESLGFTLETVSEMEGKVNVTAPWWRTDVTCAADLVEEVARIIGYDNIPATMLSASLMQGRSPQIIDFRQKVRDILVSCGLQEVLTYSLTSMEALKKLSPDLQYDGPQPMQVDHPMSREFECLRTSIRGGVLSALARNQRYGQKNIRLFELGKVFLPREKDLPDEKEILCGLICSELEELFWRQKEEAVDFYLIKGVVETLLSELGLSSSYQVSHDAALEEGQRTDIFVNNMCLGVAGQLNRAVARAYDVSGSVYIFELDLDRVFSLMDHRYIFKPLSRYPDVIRDLALIVDEGVAYQQVYDSISRFKLVSRVNLFDLYQGDQVPHGKKSMAFRIFYGSEEHTLTDAEVNGVQKAILKKLSQEFGAILRE